MTLQQRFDQLGAQRPDLALMAPYMIFLLLMTPASLFHLPPVALPVTIALRGVLSVCIVFLFRHHLPPWGRPYLGLALPIAIFVCWGWIVGQYLADYAGLPGRLPGFPGEKVYL